MSLTQLRQTLLADIKGSAHDRAIPERLHKIYETSIVDEVIAALGREISQPRKLKQVIRRIPDVNTVKKIVDKLARVYNKPATRKAKSGTTSDQKLVDDYSEMLGLNSKMTLANKLLELSKACALELYIGSDGKPKLRALANYQVRAYSGNPDDPLEITVVTKLMGKMRVADATRAEGYRLVDHYHSVSATEFMVWNDEGPLYSQPNPIGRIPMIWLNSSDFSLNPYAPESDIDSAVLVPKYYADLFYAMSYTTHSLLIGIDLNMPETTVLDPGAMLDFKTDDDGTDKIKQGRLEVVTPEIKITEALALIQQAVNDMLETKGIKPPQASSSSLERPNATAAIIESADASSHILQRCTFFYRIETELWSLIKHMHNNYWLLLENTIENKSKFSSDFKIDIQFGEVKPVEIRKESLENVKAQRELGLMSKKQALEELYPHFTDAQIEAWLEEAKADEILSEPSTPPDSFGPGGSGSGDNSPNPTPDA